MSHGEPSCLEDFLPQELVIPTVVTTSIRIFLATTPTHISLLPFLAFHSKAVGTTDIQGIHFSTNHLTGRHHTEEDHQHHHLEEDHHSADFPEEADHHDHQATADHHSGEEDHHSEADHHSEEEDHHSEEDHHLEADHHSAAADHHHHQAITHRAGG